MNRHLNILAFLIAFTCATAAHPLDNWVLQTNGVRFYAVTYGQGLFVGLSTPGTNVISTDGSTWIAHPTPTNVSLQGIAYGGGQFVAVGYSGLIMSSPDGTNWGIRASGTSARLVRVAYGNGVFMAVGELATPLTSSDGTNWFPQSLTMPFSYFHLTFGNGLFLLGGAEGTNIVSRNGTNWFPLPSGSDTGLYVTGCGDGVFMSIDIRSRVFTSLDASNWVQRGKVISVRPGQIAHGNGHFLIGGANRAEYSSDGDSWTAITNLCCYYAQAYSFAFGNGLFVTCDAQGIKKSDPIVSLQTIGDSGLRLTGPTGAVYAVESTTSLPPGGTWQPLTNFTMPASPYLWIAPLLSNSPSRFYRARLVP